MVMMKMRHESGWSEHEDDIDVWIAWFKIFHITTFSGPIIASDGFTIAWMHTKLCNRGMQQDWRRGGGRVSSD